MTIKEKKTFLASYIRAENALQASLEEYRRWETIGEKVNQVLKAVPGGAGGNDSKVERAAIEMALIMDGIQDNITEARQAKQLVIDAINSVPRLRHREILRYRYICRMSNEKIAEMIGKDVRTVYRIMKCAIYNFNPSFLDEKKQGSV